MHLDDLQIEIRDFCKEHKLGNNPEACVLDLVSEVGEVAKELLKMSEYGTKPTKFRKEMKAEVGDVLYSLITVANAFDINLQEALQLVLKKYKRRLKKGSPGSGK